MTALEQAGLAIPSNLPLIFDWPCFAPPPPNSTLDILLITLNYLISNLFLRNKCIPDFYVLVLHVFGQRNMYKHSRGQSIRCSIQYFYRTIITTISRGIQLNIAIILICGCSNETVSGLLR